MELKLMTAPGCFRCVMMKKRLDALGWEYEEIKPEEAPSPSLMMPTLFVMHNGIVVDKVLGLLDEDSVKAIKERRKEYNIE